MILQFSVEVTPRPQPRPRVTCRHAYQPRYIVEYKNLIAIEARKIMRPFYALEMPLAVDVEFRRKFLPTSHIFGDIDNHIKSVLDAMNGIVYLDDRQIIQLSARKLRSADEGITVTIDTLEVQPCPKRQSNCKRKNSLTSIN